MEVAAGPTVGLKDHVGLPVFLQSDSSNKNNKITPAAGRMHNGFCFIEEEEEDSKADDSSESSSIGAPSSSDSDDEGDHGRDDEAQSQLKNSGALGSLDSLEDSLPIKRGLSNHFAGKSKSFASLSDVAGAASSGELAKPENPFNKRRRILMACKSSWSRRASYSTLLPPLAVVEGDGESEEEDEDHPTSGGSGAALAQPQPQPLPLRRLLHGDEKFRSPRSFSLSDLQRA